MKIHDGLDSIFVEPVKWWNLSIDSSGRVKVASIWERSLQWLGSFFTNRHKDALINRVNQSLSKMPVEQIALEKIGRLAHSKNSWLYGRVPSVGNLPSVSIENLGIIPSHIQPFEQNGRFYNYPGEKIWRQFLRTLYLLFPGALSKPSLQDLRSWHRVEGQVQARSVEPMITWLGHASLLLQAENINILLDPTFDFVGPCFLRHTQPPIPFEQLPLIDVVGISHNHGDHFDVERLKKLSAMQPFAFVPQKLDSWFLKNGYTQVVGSKWWQQTQVDREGRSIRLTAIPAQHGSQTSLSDLNRTLWMGILIEVNDLKIYFAGDTAYNSEMLDEIKRHFGVIDIACLPIGPENEKEVHFDHAQALDALERLGAKKMIPIHYGAYRMGTEKIEDPLKIFLEAAEKRNLIDKVIDLRLGETFKLEQEAQVIVAQ